jgi:hypothetical protein
MLEAMRTPAHLPGGAQADYGYGTRLGATGTHRKFGHTGGGQGNKAVLARYPDDDVTVAVLLNTERSNARVTATDLEEKIERLFFGLAETPGAGAPDTARDLSGYAGQYREGPRLRRVAAQSGSLFVRPGLRQARDSRLAPGDGGAFRDTDEPEVELRFQMQGAQAQAYGRYHNGWFVALGVRQ